MTATAPGTAVGLLVDHGGVLTTSVTASFRAFCEEAALPPAALKAVIAEAYRAAGGEGVIQQLELGQISGSAFGERLAAALTQRSGVPVEGADLLARMFARVRLDERMLGAVEAIRRAGVRTGLLSNSWGVDGYPRGRFAALFDAVVVSAEVGMRKPDPAIYRHAAAALGLPCQRCVFVDDLDRNVHAAQALGMAGIVHRDADSTLSELARLLGLDRHQVDHAAQG